MKKIVLDEVEHHLAQGRCQVMFVRYMSELMNKTQTLVSAMDSEPEFTSRWP